MCASSRPSSVSTRMYRLGSSALHSAGCTPAASRSTRTCARPTPSTTQVLLQRLLQCPLLRAPVPASRASQHPVCQQAVLTYFSTSLAGPPSVRGQRASGAPRGVRQHGRGARVRGAPAPSRRCPRPRGWASRWRTRPPSGLSPSGPRAWRAARRPRAPGPPGPPRTAPRTRPRAQSPRCWAQPAAHRPPACATRHPRCAYGSGRRVQYTLPVVPLGCRRLHGRAPARGLQEARGHRRRQAARRGEVRAQRAAPGCPCGAPRGLQRAGVRERERRAHKEV